MFIRFSIISLWMFIDPFYHLIRRLKYIGFIQNKKAIFRVKLTKYKGKTFLLADGTEIKKNDCLLKIHLHNVRVLKEVMSISHPVQRTRVIYKMVEQSMPLLAKFIESHQRKEEIKGIIGITMLNKGVKKLGFELMYPENRYYIHFKRLTQTPIFLISHSTLSMKKIKNQRPTYLVMSKEKLFEKYLGA
ncbi:YkoP family protein [Heyndrickxia sp. FSL W8-0423]|uniref:YkoP family protein n=1 Tax=Heyndrickxia sp. FSL W8-0423 TaxID=2921601 RepID=UPI0030FB72AC